eukprot:684898-Hanusia_phi.AAC.1
MQPEAAGRSQAVAEQLLQPWLEPFLLPLPSLPPVSSPSFPSPPSPPSYLLPCLPPSDTPRAGSWGPSTFRKWIPAKVGKEAMETNKSDAIRVELPPPSADPRPLPPLTLKQASGPQAAGGADQEFQLPGAAEDVVSS